ncbi:MAG: 3-hydroxyisobutyrate dehydrogenase [Alphaproteobacteria bacterium]|jgi:3-hydroxyisobutyrate dehydrogenase
MLNPVGLIGVGAMGTALLERLHIAKHKVKAYDVSEDRVRYARDQGAEGVSSVAEASRDVAAVHVFVRTDEELLDVCLDNVGILATAAPGTLVFLHSTVMPDTCRQIAAAADECGVVALDAPVTAVPRHVAAGEATFLLGGPENAKAAAVAHLEPLGRAACYFGPTGAGNVAKIAKNLINANERIALSEVLAIVEAGGVDVAQFLDMSTEIDQGSTVSRWKGSFDIEGNHAVPRPASNLLNKDVHLAARLAKTLGVDTPMTQSASDTAARWVANWEKG